MSTTALPPKKTNRLGLEIINYRGGKTTLCAGCGHNAITERLVEACFELGIEPWRVAKISGIGCSSKTPAYFLGQSHGFNAVHGRAPAVATGALVANHQLNSVRHRAGFKHINGLRETSVAYKKLNCVVFYFLFAPIAVEHKERLSCCGCFVQ